MIKKQAWALGLTNWSDSHCIWLYTYISDIKWNKDVIDTPPIPKIILFHRAPSRTLYDKYLLSYEFLKISLEKILIEFFLSIYFYLVQDKKKCIVCLGMQIQINMFINIAAQLAQSFFLISNTINEKNILAYTLASRYKKAC